jgi:hypothetical protein
VKVKQARSAATGIGAVKPRREPKHIDYLGDRRRDREKAEDHIRTQSLRVDWESELATKSADEPTRRIQEIRQKARQVQATAERQELLLKEINPTNPKGVDVEEEINDALISSIKAKLSLLDD